jgi:ATP-dependent Clp protease ATP-binding subunit ClpB
MTSNIGSEFIQEMNTPDKRTQMEEAVMQSLRSAFKPEFLNRVDNVVIFHSLDREQIGKIVNIQVQRLNRLLAQRGLKLTVSDQALNLLADLGYDPVYGARPLKRALQVHLLDQLAVKLLDGTFSEGDSILADVDGGNLIFSKQ